MDTTQKISASTITEFLQSEDDNAAMPLYQEGKQRQRPPPFSQQQLYPPPPPPAYYPYYPAPLPMAPSISYLYMEFLKHLSMQNVQNEVQNFLPKFEDSTNENKSKDCKNKKESESEKKECDHHSHKAGPSKATSRLCLSCEQQLKCSCCSKPLTADRPTIASNHSYLPNCCQCFLPPHPFMHLHPNPLLSCNCAFQMPTETKTNRKSKQKSKQNKCNPMFSGSDNDVPERDNPYPMLNRVKTSKRTYNKDDSQESSGSEENYNRQENRREEFESNNRSDDDSFGFYCGEGDENKNNSKNRKSELQNNRVRKTRRSLAYFINV